MRSRNGRCRRRNLLGLMDRGRGWGWRRGGFGFQRSVFDVRVYGILFVSLWNIYVIFFFLLGRRVLYFIWSRRMGKVAFFSSHLFLSVI